MERQRLAVQAFLVFGQPAATVQPAEAALDGPALGQDNEALHGVRALDDLHLDLPHGPGHPSLELRPLAAATGMQPASERVQAKQGRHQQRAAVTAFAKRSRFTVAQGVLDVSRVDDGVQVAELRRRMICWTACGG